MICSNAMSFSDAGPDVGYEAGISEILSILSAKSSAPGGWKSFYIQTTGAALIWDNNEGTLGNKVWDDIEDIEKIVTASDTALHRGPDKVSPHVSLYFLRITNPPLRSLSPHPTVSTSPSYLQLGSTAPALHHSIQSLFPPPTSSKQYSISVQSLLSTKVPTS